MMLSKMTVRFLCVTTCALALTGCVAPSWVSDMADWTRERSENEVRGGKRPPLLNPKPSESLPSPNRVERPSAYLSAPSAGAAQPEEEPVRHVRKPFEANPSVPQGTVATAPLPAAPVAEYPNLSDVPKPPKQAASVRAVHDQYREELTQEHLEATRKKQALAEEPSQAAAPPSALKQKPAAPVAAAKPQAKPTPKSSDEPVLLGHVKDDRPLAVPGAQSSLAEDEETIALPSTAMPKLSPAAR